MTARFIVGDVLEVLPTLEENSVDLVLTSPPFLALRSYLPSDHPDKAKEGGSQPTPGAFIDWLVDVVEALDRVLAPHGSMVIELGDTYAGSAPAIDDPKRVATLNAMAAVRTQNRDITWAEAEAALEAAGSLRGAIKQLREGRLANYNDERGNPDGMRDTTFSGANTKTGGGRGWPADKSLTLIPELFRMTLVYGFNPLTGRQTRRWRLRNVIRWVRPNPPVGALGDKFRPATSELMVFCRTDEAGRRRYFDLDAVREPAKFEGDQRHLRAANSNTGSRQDDGADRYPMPGGAPPLDWWNIPLLDGEEPVKMEPKGPRSSDGYARTGGVKFQNAKDTPGVGFRPEVNSSHPLGSPPLDWWEIPPGGYSGAHYAVFPEALCVRPIKAMCPEKVCRTCGEPSRRIVNTGYVNGRGESIEGEVWPSGMHDGNLGAHSHKKVTATRVDTTLGFSDCSHDNYRPGLVLDPFAGSGTTLAVAVGHGRDAVGIDLDERNARLAEERIGFFLEVVQ